jgi:hypothetical protein
LSAKNILRDPTAKSGSQSFVFWPLHQHDECQQDTDDREDRKQDWNDNAQPHKGGNMVCGLLVVKLLRMEPASARPFCVE